MSMKNGAARSRRVGAFVAGILAVSAASAAAAPAWRHGIIEAKSDAGILMMVTRGFAERQGLDLSVLQFKSDAIGLRALLAGEIESYDGALTGTVVAASRGVDVKLIGCHWPGLPHGIFVPDRIATVADLKGRTIAISTPFSHPDVIARALLAQHDIAPAEVKFANMGGDVDRYKALVAGIVDATVVSSEYAPIAGRSGVKMLVAARDVLPDYMRLCMFSTGKTLAARQDDAVRFLAAEISALRHALAHRDEALALTREMTGIKPDDPRPGYIFDDALRTAGVDPEISIPVKKVEWMRRQLVSDGRLAASFDVRKMIDSSIRAKALDRLAQQTESK
jgi:NitT/TauT family transport system substrate-binding protein